jgi:DNA adenine methylase
MRNFKSYERNHARLAGVVIECLPYAEFITRYDRPETLFYLDPPYWGCENDYGKGSFSRDDFEVLSRLLRGLKGRFIMSINDVPEIRKLFAWADMEPVKTTYTVGKGKGKRVAGLIIMAAG